MKWFFHLWIYYFHIQIVLHQHLFDHFELNSLILTLHQRFHYSSCSQSFHLKINFIFWILVMTIIHQFVILNIEITNLFNWIVCFCSKSAQTVEFIPLQSILKFFHSYLLILQKFYWSINSLRENILLFYNYSLPELFWNS